MTSKEVEAKLCAAAGAAQVEYRAKLEALPPGAALERQAIKICLGMAEFSGKAGVMLGYASEDPIGNRRKNALEYAADEMEKEHILGCTNGELTYLHALIFMERRFLSSYREDLAKAKDYGDDKMVFRLETQIGAITAILKQWRKLGKEMGFSDAY